MAIPKPLEEAGLALEYQDDGRKLVVRDAKVEACPIRNRGGEALANLLKADRNIKVLDIREAGITDDGLGHICLALRQTDQLEELDVGAIGACGFEFVLGVVRVCKRLCSLSVSLVDKGTLVAVAQNVSAPDYDVTSFAGPPRGEDEEEQEAEDPEGEEAESKEDKLKKLQALLSANDYDSSDEAPPCSAAGQDGSEAFGHLFSQFVSLVREKEQITSVRCVGDVVPADVSLDLERIVEEHCARKAERELARKERGARATFDYLTEDLSEANLSTKLNGMRTYLGQQLFSSLGEALFECQRFKSKDNEAVATWQGECAFLAMYLRNARQDLVRRPQQGVVP